MSDVIRTRFAPSPTGYLHIGGARTALFNYLLARRLGGQFVLRIEDTDQTRNIAGAEDKLIEDMRWLGLQWDEGPQAGGEHGPYYQSRRLDRYRAVADELIAAGRAYYAFETTEELDALRKAAEAEKRNFRYPRPETFPTDAEVQAARDAGKPVVVRFKMSGTDHTIDDAILGRVELKADELDDFVMIKSDGWPTYNFAVVVDDADMRITHVLRGQEHLINTARQIEIQDALGFGHPIYAHLPIILNTDGSKMSKREKDRVVRQAVSQALEANQIDEARVRELSGCADETAFKSWRKKKTQLDSAGLERLAEELTVELPEIDIHDFRRSGYLPEVIVNFIALLGWSAGDDREKYTLDELCAAFSVERVGKTAARFDREKLRSFNTDAAAELPIDRQLAGLRDYLSVNERSSLAGLDDATLRRVLELCKGYRTFRDVEAKAGAIFVNDEQLRYDPAAVKKVLQKGDGLAVLRDVRDVLAAMETWTAEPLDTTLRGFAEQKQIGLGKVAQPVRVAVMGGSISPSISDTLELLGREKTLRRIDRALERFAADA